MSLKRTAKEYFTFSKRDKRALLILSVIIVLFSISPQLLILFSTEEKVENNSFKEDVKKFYASQNKYQEENETATEEIIQKDIATTVKYDSVIPGKKIVQLFSFDPNTLSENEFEKLGLPVRTINSILNYRKKGGKFHSPYDFKKIYNLSEEDFNRLKSFIVINNPSPEKIQSFSKTYTAFQPNSLDINVADSIEWVKLPGIGPYLTSKILNYKNALGGFYSTDQIAEVYGLKPETFESIKSKILCGNDGVNTIKKINLNTTTKDELNAHPYISSKQAVIIANFRNQHGAFLKVDDLKNADCFTEKEFNKLKPYLIVN